MFEDVKKSDDCIMQTEFLGRNIEIFRYPDKLYSVFVNDRCTQYQLSADGVIGYLGNAMMNAKS